MTAEFIQNLLTDFPIASSVKISVVIPVRDEAENIRKTLEAFARQVDLSGKRFCFSKFEILILVNNSSDDSAKIIKKFKLENPQINLHFVKTILTPPNANIGFVRRVLMNAAFARLKKNGGVIMTTDGDTIVADDWIAANLREIELGADAVGGRIIITDSELEKMDALCRETHLMDEEYRLLTAEIEHLIDDLPFDFAPRHHQHFNGSFACTTEIYEKAGGVPAVKFLEDCAFYERLQRIDARVRHSPQVKVYTSSRHVGRSEVGLSFQLNLWKILRERNEDFLVESAGSIVEKFTTRKILREIWREFLTDEIFDLQKHKEIAARIGVSTDFITRQLIKRQTFGAFYENILRRQNAGDEWTRRFPLVSLEVALEDLRKIAREKTRKSAKSFAK